MMAESFNLHIGGVPVKFPVKPYPSQIGMMAQIIKGIKKSENCLIESPTGTGKSLALLCSALAWQAREEDRVRRYNSLLNEGITDPDILAQIFSERSNGGSGGQQQQQQEGEEAVDRSGTCASTVDPNPPPRPQEEIGRRESRVGAGESQIESGGFIRDDDFQDSTVSFNTGPDMSVSEETFGEDLIRNANHLRRKRVPKIFFGTRTHKQIFQIVRELRKTEYKNARSVVLGSREHTCIHPVVSKVSSKNERCKALLDNKDGEFCTYNHGSSRIKSEEQLVPYGLRPAWDLEDLVKVGRAAKSCPYFVSRNLMMGANIVFCPYNYLIDPLIRESMNIELRDHILILDEAHNIEDCSREAASSSFTQDLIIDAKNDLEKLGSHDSKAEYCQPLIQMLSNLSLWMEGFKDKLTDYQQFGSTGKIFSGAEIVKEFRYIDMDKKNSSKFEKCFNKLTEDNESEEENPKPLAPTCQLLNGFFLTLRYLFKNDLKNVEDYKVALLNTQNFLLQKQKSDKDGWIKMKSRLEKHFVYSLNFWCLNPGVTFTEIAGKTRSIILTSGTLSPMNSFESELGVKFPIKFEANHVIQKDQVLVSTISKGPTNLPLNATYKHSETFAFQDELGRLILDICEAVPRGILCFLPSYAMLNKLVERWKASSLWEQISKLKFPVVEPRKSEDFENSMKLFYETVKSTKNAEEGTITGALFIAVCRGKVSEGLDFTDDNARAVIAVGIPYPHMKDIQVNLKMKYNDSFSKSKGLLPGSNWYEIQAFRALNQALGRCIRHRFDWGALLLIDERFQKGIHQSSQDNRYVQGLSKWVRHSLQHESSFSSAIDKLKQYSIRMKSYFSDETMESLGANNAATDKENVSSKFSTAPIFPANNHSKNNLQSSSNHKKQVDNIGDFPTFNATHQNIILQIKEGEYEMPSPKPSILGFTPEENPKGEPLSPILKVNIENRNTHSPKMLFPFTSTQNFTPKGTDDLNSKVVGYFECQNSQSRTSFETPPLKRKCSARRFYSVFESSSRKDKKSERKDTENCPTKNNLDRDEQSGSYSSDDMFADNEQNEENTGKCGRKSVIKKEKPRNTKGSPANVDQMEVSLEEHDSDLDDFNLSKSFSSSRSSELNAKKRKVKRKVNRRI